MIFQLFLKFVFGNVYSSNSLVFSFFNMFIVLLINNEYYKINGLIKKALILGGAISFIISITSGAIIQNYKGIVIVIVVIILKHFASKSNYEEIETTKVKQGMILSFDTVNKFKKSRVKGLPLFTTENIRSKISQEEVDSIKRWQKSKYGMDRIIIIRKMPFAIFISIGFVIYAILGGVLWFYA